MSLRASPERTPPDLNLRQSSHSLSLFSQSPTREVLNQRQGLPPTNLLYSGSSAKYRGWPCMIALVVGKNTFCFRDFGVVNINFVCQIYNLSF